MSDGKALGKIAGNAYPRLSDSTRISGRWYSTIGFVDKFCGHAMRDVGIHYATHAEETDDTRNRRSSTPISGGPGETP